MLQIALCDPAHDDLIHIQSELEACLESHSIKYSITAFQSGEELLRHDKKYQLFILEISLHDEVNGIEIGCEIHNRNRFAQIIYITNYEEYCLQAINQAHPFAYLDKPITREELEEHVLSAIALVQDSIEDSKNRTVCLEILNQDDSTQTKTIYQKFNMNEICYFEYCDRKVRIRMLDGSEYYFQDTMKELTERMKPYHFALCHKSYLINLYNVKSIKGYEVYMQNGDIVPLAQRKSVEFRSKLSMYMSQSVMSI